ncbi:MAG: DUF4965 domain-containing protein [Clostridia bacterium]|nr:DUF4965 domain-containing protein [Clostridia bacterium]
MASLRTPAVPLVTVDPYFNIWSSADVLTDDVPRHWTGRRHSMTGMVKVDGVWHRFMGKLMPDNLHYYREEDPMTQVSCEISPLITTYCFECEEIALKVRFFTPLLMDDLKIMSRPVSYVDYEITAKDGKDHKIEFYYDASAEIAVDHPSQAVRYSVYENGASCGRGDQDVLGRSGDDLRIEWGYLHLFSKDHASSVVTKEKEHTRYRNFRNSVAEITNLDREITVSDGWLALALRKEYDLAADGCVKNFICIGYDDLYSIQYFGKNIKCYWTKDGETFTDIQKLALEQYEELLARCQAFDKDLLTKASAHGEKYCDILSTVYRQVISAHKLSWNGESFQFLSKENFSNGCIGTVDVTYPSIPLFLLYRPELIFGMLDPIFVYANSDAWPYRYAPHDVGQYPLANGQVYGMTKKYFDRNPDAEAYQMPVEECGNMLLCVAAACKALNDPSYAKKHEVMLQQWVDYLMEKGLDPENQLCTDDFAGHLAHNANLSVKAIMGIAAWGMLKGMMGDKNAEANYISVARDLAKQWKEKSYDSANGCYRLAFDQPETWSIKYNLVWDKLFGLDIFDKDIFETEVNGYLKRINRYGLPLDCRKDYSKSDWQMWSTVLTDNKEYEQAIINAMWTCMDEIRERVPFSDWYNTSTPHMVGFQNRTVQGGLFINLLKY